MTISNFKLVELADKYKVALRLSDIKYIEDLTSCKLKKFMNLILNFSSPGYAGAHFVSFLVRDKKAFYMDSFGAYPLEQVVDYCKLNSLQLGYNAKVIQDSSTTTCGVYCFALLKYAGKSGNLYKKCNEFLDIFDNNTTLNNDILHTLLNNLGIQHEYK